MTRALRQTRTTIGRSRLLCCSALGLVLAAVEVLPARAAPAGASVPAGVASAPTITSSGSVTDVKLNQSRTLIDWNSFQIGKGETVNFRFDNGSDVVLNRVLGQAVVDGALNGLVGAKTGGNVWLYGGQGVVFGPNARVNVGSLLATTTPLSSMSEFLSGSNTFTFQGGLADASILARSGAQLSSRGALALIAPSVATEAGAKVTAGGTALYGSAQNFRIHFGEGAGGNLDLVDFEVPASALEDGSVSTTPLAIAGDTTAGRAMFAAVNRPSVMNAVISLGGLVTAQSAVQGEGGDIILSASGAPASVKVGGVLQADRSVTLTAAGGKIEVSGAVTARDASGQGGSITLGDGATAAVQLGADSRVDVASLGAGQAGGRAVATGAAVDVQGAIDASGPAGGGDIRIGGGFHGQEAAVANADNVSVAPWALLKADATAAGDGGSAVVWSQKFTDFRGLIQARGGPGGGHGGRAEVSSADNLHYVGLADLTAPMGATGGLLLDPTDIDIKNVGGGSSDYHSATEGATFAPTSSSTVDTDEIVKQIKAAVLTISADGQFTFDDTVTYNNATDSFLLTLQAGGGFKFNADPFAVTGAGVLNVNMTASYNGSHAGFTLGSGRTLTVGGGALTINADSITLTGQTTAGQLNLTSTAGDISGGGNITTTTGLSASAAGGSVDLHGAANAVGGTIALAGGNVTFSNNQTTSIDAGNVALGGGGALSLTTTAGDLTVTNALTTPGALTLTAAGVLTTPALTATTGDLSLTGGSISLGGAVTSSAGAVSLTVTTAATALTVSQTVHANTSVSLQAPGDITQTAAITSVGLSATSSGASVDLGGSNAISGTVSTFSGVNLTLNSSSPFTVAGAGVTASHSLILTSSGLLATSGALSVAGGVALTGSSVSLGGAVGSTAGSVGLQATGGALTVDHAIQAATAVNLEATGAITQSAAITALTGLSAVSSGGDVILDSAANAIGGTVTSLSGHTVTLVDGSALTVTGGGLSASVALNLTSSSALTVATTALSTSGNISLKGTSLDLGPGVRSTAGGVALEATASALTITPGTDFSAASYAHLTASGALAVNADLDAVADISLTGASITLGGHVQSTASGVSMTATGAGGLTVDAATIISNDFLTLAASTGPLTVNGALSAPGDISLTGASLALGPGASVTSTGAGVVLDATASGLTLDGALISAPSPTGGFISVTSSGPLLIDGTVTTPGDVSLTGSSVAFSLGSMAHSTGGGVAIEATASDLAVTPGTDFSAATFVRLTASGILDVNGPLTQAGDITLSGASVNLGGFLWSPGAGTVTVNSTAGPFTLNEVIEADNGGVTVSAAGLLVLNSLIYAPSGAVNLSAAGGDITELGGGQITAGSLSASATGGGSVSLTSTANTIGAITGLSGANVSLFNGPSFTVAGFSTTGALTLISNGQITTTGALSTNGSISLTGSSLSLGGQVQSTTGGVSLVANSSGLTLDPSTDISAHTFVTLTTNGALTLTGALTAPGAIALTGSSISLGGGLQSTGSTVSLNAFGSALALTQTLQAFGAVSLSAGGAITQSASAAITSNGLSASATGGAVVLDSTNNAFTGAVTGLSGSAITLVDSQGFTVTSSGVSTAGAVNLTSTGGQLALSAGLTELGAISLTGDSLSLGGTVHSTGASVTLHATGSALSVNQLVQATGAVNLQASGDITQTAGISAGAGFSAVSSGGLVDLTSASNFISGTVTGLSGSSVTLKDASAMTVAGPGVASTGAVTLTSTGGLLSVTGALSASGDIALTGASLGLGGAVQSTGGDVSLNATAAALALGQQVQANGALHLQALGDITQTAAFTADGFTAASTLGSVNLASTSNVISGTVASLSGVNVTLRDSQAMTVTGPGVSVTGDLTLTSDGLLTVNNTLAAGGNIALTGTSLVTDTVNAGLGLSETSTTGNLSTGTVTANGNIGLTGATLTVNGAVKSNFGSVTLGATAGDIALDNTIQAATTVILSARDGITQTAAVTAGTGLSATSTTGDIDLTLTSTSNAVSGPVSLSGHNVAFRDGQALTVSSVSASGTLDLTSLGALSVTGALLAGDDISLTGAALSLGGAVTSTGGGVTLDSTSAALAINQALTAGPGETVNLISSGPISQSSTGLITASVLTGHSTGGAVLGQNNLVNALGAFTNSGSGALTIISGLDLALTGPISDAPGQVGIVGKSLAVNSAVTGNSVVLVSTNGDVAGSGVLTAAAGMEAVAQGGQVALGGVNQVAGPVILSGAGVTFVNGQTTTINPGDISSTGGVSLATTAGDLNINGALSLPGSVTLTAAGVLTTPALTTTGGDVSLTGASIALGGNIQAAAGAVNLQSIGALTLNHNIATSGAVTLVSAAQVLEDASGAAVTAGHLAVTAGGGIALNNANSVPFVDSLVNTGSGGVSFRDVAGATALGVVSTGGGDVQLSTAGDLALTTAITVPAGLTLTAGGALTGATLHAGGGMTLAGASGVTLDALTAGQGITASASGGAFTSGALTLGGNLSLSAAGTVTIPQILGQATSQLAVSGGNVVLGAASGQAPGPGQSVQGVLSVTAQQDASLNLSGDLAVARITAGHAASVSVQNGSVQVASATLGAGAASLSIAATGGDAVLGAAAGSTPAAGNVVTAPTSAAIAVTADRDAVVNLAGPVTIATLAGGRDAIARTTAGDLAVASGKAGRNLTVTSDSGSANLKTATLTGAGALALTAAKTATLGRLPGEAAPTAAGSLTLGVPAQDSVTVTAPSVVVDLAGDAALISVKATGGDASVGVTGALNLAQASATGKLTVNAGGAATIGSASAGGDATITSGGALNLAQASTPGALTVKAAGAATIGTASAGGLGSIVSGAGITVGGSLTGQTLLLRGHQLALNGPVQANQACGSTCTAPTLTIESAGGGLELGAVTGGSGGMQISNAELASIKADAVSLYAGDTTNAAARGNVTIGDLTLDGAKIKTLSVFAGPTSKVNVIGAVLPAAGGGSALVIGAPDSASGWTPQSIYITGDKGGLGGGDPSLPLASQKPLPSVTLNAVGDVLFGRDSFVTAITGVEAAGHANTINVDRNIPAGVAVVGADLNRVFLTADTMTVRANGVIAQENTGITGTSNGIILTNRTGARYFATLGRTGPPAAGAGFAPLVIDLSLAYFNATGLLINQQIAAASPGVNLGELPRSDLYRINGCTIGAAGSCTPLPNTIVDISIGKLVQDIRLIAQAPPAAYDPTITGAGNEEIWRTNTCAGGSANGSGSCQ
jgi:filamentous hemagglutinin family protein